MPPIPYLQGVPRNQNLGFEQLNSLYSLAYGDDYNPQYLQDAVDVAREYTPGAQYRLFNPDMSPISVTTDRLQYIQDLYDRFARGQKVETAPVEEGRYRLYNFSNYDPNTGEVTVNKNNPAEFDQNRLDKDGVIFNKVSWGLDKLSRGFNYITPSNYIGSAIQVANGDIPLSDYLDNVAKGNQGIFESEAIKKYAEEHPWVNASLHAGQTVLDLYGQGKGINLFLNTANKIGKGVNAAIDTAKQAVGGFSKGVKRAAMRNILKQEVAAGNMTEEEAIIYAQKNGIPLDEEYLAQRSAEATKQLPQQASAEKSLFAGDPELRKQTEELFRNLIPNTYPRLPEFAEQENEIAKITEDYYERVLKPLFIKQGVTPRESLYGNISWAGNTKPQFAYNIAPENPKIQGWHSYVTGANMIKADNELDPVSVAIHEATGHGTENMLTPAINGAYQKGVDTLDHTLFKIKGSKLGKEYRATLQEVRKALEAEYTLPDGSIDLQRIRDVPDQRILDIMKTVNGYGQDYVNVYNQSSPSVQKAFMDQSRELLMNYPSDYLDTTTDRLPFYMKDGNWDFSNASADIAKGKQDFINEITSPEYRERAEQLRKEAEEQGLLYTPTYEKPGFQRLVNNGVQVKLANKGMRKPMGNVGMFEYSEKDPSTPISITLNRYSPQQYDIVASHEIAHGVGHGIPNPEPPIEVQMKEQQFLRQKSDEVFIPNFEPGDYVFTGAGSQPTEAYANSRDLGKDLGVRFAQPYPGDEAVIRLLNSDAARNSIKSGIIKGFRMDNLQAVWRALNGTQWLLLPFVAGAAAATSQYKKGGKLKLSPRKYSKGGAYTRPETEQNMLHRSKVESKDQELKDRNSVKTAANDAIAIVSDLYEKLQNNHSTIIVSDLMDVSGDVFSNLFKNNPTLKYGISTLMRTPGIFEAVGAVCNMLHTKTVTFDQIRDVLAIVPGKVGMIMSALNLFIDLGLATAEQVNKAKATTLWVDQLNRAINKENIQVQFNQDGSYNAAEVKVPPAEDLSDKGISYILTKFPKIPETDEEVNAYLTKFQ